MKIRNMGKLLLVVLLVMVSLVASAWAEDEASLVEAVETVQVVEQEAPEEKPTFTLAFLADDGEVIFAEQLKQGDPIVAPFFAPTKDGGLFSFWYDANKAQTEGRVEAFKFNVGIEADTVLKPFFEEIAKPADETPVASIEEIGQEPEREPEVEQDAANLEGQETSSADKQEEQDGLALTVIDDPDEEPEAPPVSRLASCAIRIYSSLDACISEGTTVDLWAELVGFEGLKATFQWQYFDGEWHDVQGATDIAYTFDATEESVNYGWRLAASVEDPGIA